VARVIIADLLTGRRLVDIPYLKYAWSRRRNRPETLSCEVKSNNPDVRALNLRNTATGGKTALAIVEENGGGEWFAGAGEMNEPDYDDDAHRITLTASGIIDYFKGRTVLPPAAATVATSSFVIPDPADSTKTIPNPALGTMFTGLSLGTILKKIIEQALSWPSANLPIVLPADIAGVHTKTWDGIAFKSVSSAIADISNLEGGPDFRADARHQADRKGIEWLLRTGTDTAPIIRSATTHRWDLTAQQSNTRRLRVGYDAGMLGSVSWVTGGRSADIALVERASSNTLTDAGYPLREVLDSSRVDVVERPTAQRYAQENLRRAQGAIEVYSFQVRKDSPPYLGQYDVGDWFTAIVKDNDWLPDGWHLWEITGMSGDEGPWVTITAVKVGI
jgi:hypothetical protein